MPNEFRMPSLGPDMESGTLVKWQVKSGDAVKRGDIVAQVETDKGVIDVEIFDGGTIEKLLVEEGAHVPVGTALALLRGEATADSKVVPPRIQPEVALRESQPVQSPLPAAPHARVKISPAARSKAHVLSIDPSTITGTGAGGVITLEDIVKHAAAASEAPAAAHAPDMRQVIAKAMSRSKREIPHYYLVQTCPVNALRSWLDQHNASVSVEERILPIALFLKAVATAARALPEFNGFYGEQGFAPSADVNVGVAIAMRGGRLVAPALLQADTKSPVVLMQELRDLTNRVRSGHMRGSELSLPTITVTSLAEEGPDLIVPVIYPPQVAMVGFGSIQQRPWVVEGSVKPASLVQVSLAADHRVTDGRAGARFLSNVSKSLMHPETL